MISLFLNVLFPSNQCYDFINNVELKLIYQKLIIITIPLNIFFFNQLMP